jgi:hypothetical protein
VVNNPNPIVNATGEGPLLFGYPWVARYTIGSGKSGVAVYLWCERDRWVIGGKCGRSGDYGTYAEIPPGLKDQYGSPAQYREFVAGRCSEYGRVPPQQALKAVEALVALSELLPMPADPRKPICSEVTSP